MVFHRDEHSRGTEQSAPHFQVPRVVIATAQRQRALRSQGGFKRLEPFIDSQGTLAPDIGQPGPRQCETGYDPLAPQGESLAQSPAEPRERLEQMQAGG